MTNGLGTGRESAELNIRGLDPQLVEQVRIAALRRGGRAALRNWMTQAIARQLRSELEPAPAPRLFLCAGCVARNRARAAEFSRQAPPQMQTSVAGPARGAPEPSRAPSVLARLLEQVEAEGERDGKEELAPVSPPGAGTEAAAAADDEAVVEQPPSFEAVEVAPGLWVGSDDDWRAFVRRGVWLQKRPDDPALKETGDPLGWSILQAAREPWHREMVGYETRSAPEGPERLVARRNERMALNLIDVRELGPGGECYVPEEVIVAAMAFLAERLAAGDQVLVHAGDGTSAAPTIALLYAGLPLKDWRQKYPRFEPRAGMKAYLARTEMFSRLREAKE